MLSILTATVDELEVVPEVSHTRTTRGTASQPAARKRCIGYCSGQALGKPGQSTSRRQAGRQDGMSDQPADMEVQSSYVC